MLDGKVARFHHRGTHWWVASLYEKQWNQSGFINWLDYLAKWFQFEYNWRYTLTPTILAWLWAHCRADRTTSMTSSLMDDPTDQDGLLLKHQLNSFKGNSIATSILLILSRAVVRASWSSQELFLSNSALGDRVCFVTLLTDRIGGAIG